jgi:hypothetical protein
VDTTIADLRKIRAPLMQYRRIRELLQFVRDTSANRAGKDPDADAALEFSQEPRKTSRI